MEFKKIFINFALLGLVVFGMMSFIIIMQHDNNSTEKITDNAIINKTYNDLYINLSVSQDTANSQNDIFGKVKPTETFGNLDVDSAVSPTQAFKSIVLGIYNILIKLPSQILGVSPIVGAVISAILIMILIIGIWAIWKGSVSG